MKTKLLTSTKNLLDILYLSANTCYSALSPIERLDRLESIDNTKKLSLIEKCIRSGHESVLEHSQFSFAIEGVSRALLAQLTRHRMCLSGDTEIMRYSGSKKSKTIKQLYEEWQIPQMRGPLSSFTARTVNLDNKLIEGTKIANVFYNGVQDVYELKTKLGYSIKATLNHKFFNANGEFKLGQLEVGDKVYVNGIELYKDKEWCTNKYTNEGYSSSEIAYMCGIKTSTSRKWKRKHNIETNNKNYSRIFSEETKRKLSEANSGKTMSEETKQKLSLSNKNRHFKPIEEVGENRLREIHRQYKTGICAICGTTENLEAHHIDKNYTNYNKENCITLCSSCHHRIHGKNKKFKNVFEDEIVSIQYVGKEDTYDLETVSDRHNYIANGFLVHNCSFSVKSQRYVQIKEDKAYLQNVLDRSETQELLGVAKNYFVVDSPLQARMAIKALVSYATLLENGQKPEDARSVLPNCTKTDLVMTCNLRQFIHLCNERLCTHAQLEIRTLLKHLVENVLEVEPWLKPYLQPKCEKLGFCPEHSGCGRKEAKN